MPLPLSSLSSFNANMRISTEIQVSGMNLRITSDSRQGDRQYMEDVLCVGCHHKTNNDDADFVYLAVFDGHGGKEAALFAKQNLLGEILKNKGFWSNDDQQVLKAMRDAFISTHKLMWGTVEFWPRRCNGHRSTAGTTASVVVIRDGRLYIAHVGDSGVLVGVKDEEHPVPQPHCLTQDHKPNSPEERKRIEEDGGQVMTKAGVHRVVWNRPKALHNGPIRRSTQLDQIPFLAVARSLGDLWSYNSQKNRFVVSPEPDMQVYHLDVKKHKFIVLASDGLWNIMKPKYVTKIIHKVATMRSKDDSASVLVSTALSWWGKRRLRADNTSAIVVYLDELSAAALPSSGPLENDRLAGENSPFSCLGAARTTTGRQVVSDITNSAEKRAEPPGDCIDIVALPGDCDSACLQENRPKRRVQWTHHRKTKRQRCNL